jgi:hypothetical protein
MRQCEDGADCYWLRLRSQQHHTLDPQMEEKKRTDSKGAMVVSTRKFQQLDDLVEGLKEDGISVLFWCVNRRFNTGAGNPAASVFQGKKGGKGNGWPPENPRDSYLLAGASGYEH